jgi:gliding motility-associated-like protein
LVASYFNPQEICNYKYEFINRSEGATKYKWDFGIPNRTDDTSIINSPTFTYPDSGSYEIQLIAINDDCTDTIREIIEVVKPVKPVIPSDTFFCEGKSVTLNIPQDSQTYLWSDGQISQTASFDKPGRYTAAILYKTCKWFDTIDIIEDKPNLQIAGDTFYCSYDDFVRDLYAVDSNSYNSILWSTGSTKKFITTNEIGEYVANSLSLLNCPSSDTAFIIQYPEIILPQLDTIVCPYTPVQFDSEIIDGDVTWTTSGGTSTGRMYTTSSPSKINLKVVRGVCKKDKDFTFENYPFEFGLGEDLRYCETIDTLLQITDTRFSKIIWNKEVSGRVFQLKQPGKVVVRLLNQYNCPEADSLNVNLFFNPALNLRSDTTVCVSNNPLLDGGSNMKSYSWSTGETSRTISAMKEGLYWVRILSQEGCFTQDSVYITKDPDLYPNKAYMPNAFSPNGNGINEVYPDNKFYDVGVLYSVKLYNRWGEKVADYNTTEANWDGTINGRPAPEGAYVYQITYIGCDNELYRKAGTFHLLR